MNKKGLLIVGSIVMIIIIGIAFYFMSSTPVEAPAETPTENEEAIPETMGVETPSFRYNPKGTTWDYNGGTITFEDGFYTMNFGCNVINGQYTVARVSLDFAPPVSTRKACPPEIAEKEQDFAALIVQMTTFADMPNNTAKLSGKDAEMILE